jgi:hypothetical protein
MAFEIEKICKGKSLPVKYWRVFSLQEFNPMTKRAVVTVAGYSTQKSRDAVGDDLERIDQVYDFLITNWVEKEEVTRPSTIEEKKVLFPNLSDEELALTLHDQLMKVNEIYHNDFDELLASFPDWKVGAYAILTKAKYSSSFFDGAKSV